MEGSWMKGRLLGSGSYGRVHMAVCTDTAEVFAVKSAGGAECDGAAKNAADLGALENEISIMAELGHPKIVQYKGCEWSKEEGHLVRHMLMEYMPAGSLADLIKELGGHLEETLIRNYTKDILEALSYLHSQNIVHGDIKGHNILVATSGVKIADFGTSFKAGNAPRKTKHCGECVNPKPSDELLCFDARQQAKFKCGVKGTISWMSPEAAKDEVPQGTAGDIWSLGCTMIEMATGRPPWSEIQGGAFAVLYAIGCTENLPELPAGLSPAAHDFVTKCLQRDPEKRPTAAELLQHPFITDSPLKVKLTINESMAKNSSSDDNSPTSPSFTPSSPSMFVPLRRVPSADSPSSPLPFWAPWMTPEPCQRKEGGLAEAPKLLKRSRMEAFPEASVSSLCLDFSDSENAQENEVTSDSRRASMIDAISKGKGSLSQYRSMKRSVEGGRGEGEEVERRREGKRNRLQWPSPVEIPTRLNAWDELESMAPITPDMFGCPPSPSPSSSSPPSVSPNGIKFMESSSFNSSELGRAESFGNFAAGQFDFSDLRRKWIVVRSPR